MYYVVEEVNACSSTTCTISAASWERNSELWTPLAHPNVGGTSLWYLAYFMH